MKRWACCLIAMLALATAAGAAAQGTKWHPGHYVMVPGDVPIEDHMVAIAELSDETAIQGVMVRFWWYDLEPERDVYDFSLIDTYLEALRELNTTKRLVVRIMDRRFNTRRSREMLPDYLLEDPIFNGGFVNTSTGFAARIWEQPVMDRLIALYQALGQRYDSEPLFEGAFTEESTLSFRAPDYPEGYSNDLLVAQYVRFLNAVKPTMPTSNLFFNANWIGSPELMSVLIQTVHDTGAAAGGSNVIPGSLTLGQRVLTGVYGADYRSLLPIANGVERGELGGALGDFTPPEIGAYAYEPLHTHYLFWLRNMTMGTPEQQWHTGILPYLRTRPPLHTSCPVTYGICLTDDVPPPLNEAPVVSAGADATVTQETVTLAGSVADDGRPGPLASVQWTQIVGPEPAIFVDATSPTTAVTLPSSGVYVLRLTASDGELSSSDDVTLTVTLPPPNAAPVVSAGADAAVTQQTVTLAGSVTDDGRPGPLASVRWTQVVGPEPALFVDAESPTTAVTLPSSGVYMLRLTASDGELSSSDDVTLTVTLPPPPPENRAPQVSAGSDVATQLPTAVVRLTGAVTDDGLPTPSLSFAWTQVSGPAAASFASASALSTQVSFATAGSYVLRLTADDGELSASDDVVVTVNAAPPPPPPPPPDPPPPPPDPTQPAEPPPVAAPLTSSGGGGSAAWLELLLLGGLALVRPAAARRRYRRRDAEVL